ncbi:MAG: DUF6371 domain-containing protein [Rikenellaceae bacterium]
MKYQLQKYKGRSTKHTCPECGKRYCFTLYVDESNTALDDRVGRCDHESSCGYHYTPKMYFEDNPLKREDRGDWRSYTPPKPTPPRFPDFIPREYVTRSEGPRSDFVRFLSTLTDGDTLCRLMNDYHLGNTRSSEVIYWQIDRQHRVRTGKVMAYRPDGHRNKDRPPNWVHSIMKRQQQISEDYNLVQCLFGEHLLTKYPAKVVAVVESEKSAILGSIVFPEYIWVATGGKSQLDRSKMRVLEGREVIMFPDVDGYSEWVERAKQLTFARVKVSDLLERRATEEERERKIDIGDWIVEHLQRPKEPTALERFVNLNPLVQTLIDSLDLEVAI